jgi:alpha-D-xyloside xylohydrolase
MHQKASVPKTGFFSIAMPAIVVMMMGFQWSWGLSITSYTKDNDGITCTCDKGVMKVKICKEDIVRVAYSPTSTIPTRPLKIVTNTWATAVTFTQTESGDIITLQTSRIKVKVAKATANVTYTDLSDAVICSEYAKTMTSATVEGVSTYTVRGEFNSPSDEGLYGLGQHQAGKVNYKGQTEVLDNDYGSKATAVPVLISTKGYGIFWDSYAKINFSGNISGNTRYALSSECGDVLDYYFFYGPEIDQVISGYRTATGKAPLFPKWGYGLIQSRDRYGSQTEIFGVKDGYRNNKIPLDCIVQDWHYWDGAGKQGCYCFNSSYGNVKTTITTLHSANIHTMISIWSQLEDGSPPFSNFNSKGWLWPSDGATHFIDAYNAEARDAFWNLIRDAFFDPNVQGWDAWWLDNDEPFPYPNGFNRRTLTTAMGKGVLFYNTYTFPMSEMGYKNWRRDIPNKRFVMLHRANFAGQQAHSCMQWSNDIDCNWPTLNKSVPSGLNSTATGIPYWCTDIGGYWGSSGINWSTAENNELFTRWFQYGAFCPVFRIHGNGPSKELYQNQWSATTKANLLLVDKLHYRLMPYIYSLAWMTTNAGYTIMRHLVFDFRTDANVKSIGDQFMYGPAIMVSPVTTQGQTSRSVYLPAGKWYDFWTGATVNGGAKITASAPLSQIPLHIRAGSIVPMGPEIQYATERADTIELRVYSGANGSFTIYEDEGDNYNYETGKYATIPITYVDNPQNVIIGDRSGSFTGMDAKKVFNIVYVASNHGTGEGKTASPDCQLIYNGAQVSCVPVGTLPLRSGAAGALPAEFSIKSAARMIMLPNAFSGKTKTITVYDCSGKLLQRAVVKKNIIDVQKDLRLPAGVYIVKARVIR